MQRLKYIEIHDFRVLSLMKVYNVCIKRKSVVFLDPELTHYFPTYRVVALLSCLGCCLSSGPVQSSHTHTPSTRCYLSPDTPTLSARQTHGCKLLSLSLSPRLSLSLSTNISTSLFYSFYSFFLDKTINLKGGVDLPFGPYPIILLAGWPFDTPCDTPYLPSPSLSLPSHAPFQSIERKDRVEVAPRCHSLCSSPNRQSIHHRTVSIRPLPTPNPLRHPPTQVSHSLTSHSTFRRAIERH